MIQCKQCEFCQIGSDGQKRFTCDPFSNIKEPECIQKWQLIRLEMLVASYQGMLKWYEKLSPIQNKLFKYMEHEIDEQNEADNWKIDNDEEDDEEG